MVVRLQRKSEGVRAAGGKHAPTCTALLIEYKMQGYRVLPTIIFL